MIVRQCITNYWYEISNILRPGIRRLIQTRSYSPHRENTCSQMEGGGVEVYWQTVPKIVLEIETKLLSFSIPIAPRAVQIRLSTLRVNAGSKIKDNVQWTDLITVLSIVWHSHTNDYGFSSVIFFVYENVCARMRYQQLDSYYTVKIYIALKRCKMLANVSQQAFTKAFLLHMLSLCATFTTFTSFIIDSDSTQASSDLRVSSYTRHNPTAFTANSTVYLEIIST